MAVSFAKIPSLDEVVPGLFIGSCFDAGFLNELKSTFGITHVLSIGNFSALFPDDFEYKIFNIEDDESVDIMCIFSETNQFIEDALNGSFQGSKGKVFVHCMAGISRSASVVAAYLMKSEKLSAKDALLKLKAARKIISPNAGFRAQLNLYEQMNYQLDETYPLYKASKGNLEDIIFEPDPEETLASSLGTMTDQVLCCKVCKRALAIQENEVKHTRGRSFRRIIVDKSEDQLTELCNPYFYHYIPPLRWMVGLEKESSGPLECPRCDTRIGIYMWVGITCSCSQIILPGFALLKSRVIEGGWEKR